MSEKKTKTITIDLRLYNEISEYCKINNIKVNVTIENMLRKQFLIEKWGEKPQIFTEKQINLIQEEKKDKVIVVETIKEIDEITNTKEKIMLVKPSKRRLK